MMHIVVDKSTDNAKHSICFYHNIDVKEIFFQSVT